MFELLELLDIGFHFDKANFGWAEAEIAGGVAVVPQNHYLRYHGAMKNLALQGE